MQTARLKPLALWAAALLAVCAVAACCLTVAPQQAHAASTVSVKVSGKVDYSQSFKVIAKLNKLRKQKGLKALTVDTQLMKAAEQRAAEVSVAYAHTRPNGKECFTVSKYVNGENIAIYPDAASVFTAWKNSKPHYKNMTQKLFKTVGICCYKRDGVTYWVNLFGIDKSKKYSKKSGVKTKKHTVKIAKKYLTKKAIYFDPSVMGPGEKATVRVYFAPSIAQAEGTLPNSMFTFKSSKTSIATVTKKGVVTSKAAEGTTKLTLIPKGKKTLKVTQTLRVDEEFSGFDDDYYF